MDPSIEYTNLCAAHDMLPKQRGRFKVEETDCLIVVDMQNDFLPIDIFNPCGGRFAVPGGANAAARIVELIAEFADKGARIVATRDYHPHDHVSFLGCSPGAEFPPHCIQGSEGSKFYPPVKTALELARSKSNKPLEQVQVAFKGFHEDVESFGAFTYPDKYVETRTEDPRAFNVRPASASSVQHCMGCELMPWTGAFVLKQSNLLGGEKDLDAPPDVLAAIHSKLTLKDALAGCTRVFCVGLALDFCVLDTAINGKLGGFKEVVLIFDAGRPAHIPGIGKFGSGFLLDPAWVCAQVKKHDITVCLTEDLLPIQTETKTGHNAQPMAVVTMAGPTFPDVLPKMGLTQITAVKLKGAQSLCTHMVFRPCAGGQWTVTVDLDALGLRFLQGLGVKPETTASSRAAVSPGAGVQRKHRGMTPRTEKRPISALGNRMEATHFHWVYPLPGVAALPQMTIGYFVQSHPMLSFLLLGGFVFLDAAGAILDACAIELHAAGGGGIKFGKPTALHMSHARALASARRWCPITLDSVKEAGATHFTWLQPTERLTGASTTEAAPPSLENTEAAPPTLENTEASTEALNSDKDQTSTSTDESSEQVEFVAPDNGAFGYLFSDDGNLEVSEHGRVDTGATAIFFAVEDWQVKRHPNAQSPGGADTAVAASAAAASAVTAGDHPDASRKPSMSSTNLDYSYVTDSDSSDEPDEPDVVCCTVS